MVLNLEKVDDRIERLAKLREFLNDPETAQLLREIIEAAVQARMDAAKAAAPAQDILPSNVVQRGSVIAATYRAAVTFPATFTGDDVQKRMQEMGYRFTAARPEVAVNSALRKLIERGAIRIVSRGSGRRPNMYERIPQQVPEGGRQGQQRQ
jgi:hypothetical protein